MRAGRLPARAGWRRADAVRICSGVAALPGGFLLVARLLVAAGAHAYPDLTHPNRPHELRFTGIVAGIVAVGLLVDLRLVGRLRAAWRERTGTPAAVRAALAGRLGAGSARVNAATLGIAVSTWSRAH